MSQEDIRDGNHLLFHIDYYDASRHNFKEKMKRMILVIKLQNKVEKIVIDNPSLDNQINII